jgi:2-oxoglutarate dehydrogenase E2 component (dihydrolipoamide succinyltransferase)
MAIEIRVPSLGESIVDAVVVQWLKKPGEQVARSEPIVELETDKVNVEVPADQAGVLQSVEREVGATVAVGEVLGTIDVDARVDAPIEQAPAPQVQAEKPDQPEAVVATERAPEPVVAASGGPAGPAVRRIATERAVDLSQVQGSGPGGRILPQDLRAVPSLPATQPPAPVVPPTPSATSPNGREERVRLSRRRQTIAARLVEAQQTAAMLTTFNEVDMSAVMSLRTRRREDFEKRHGVRLGFMSFFTKAAVWALKAYPQLNSELQGDELVLKHYYDIGIAVGADEGLVVPVVRNADQKSFAEIEREIRDLGQRAQERKLSIEELQGGTFTITNGGVFGSLMSTPILNTPQVGILGMHKIQDRPMAVNGEVVIRPMMYLALSYDHRVVDGREAVQFLVKIKELIEDPEAMLLEG